MSQKLRYYSRFFFVLALGIFLATSEAKPQQTEPIGGPYEADSATVLLMHFNQSFQNASEFYEIGEPRTYGNISFLQMQGAGDLGYQVQFDNDSPDDKSHIQIPDTTALDLQGSWTMEMWVNVFTFGTTQDDWRRQPRLYFKPGDPGEAAYWQSNYAFNIFGTQRDFAVTYWSEEIQDHINIRSPENILRIGEWFHLTFIRDTVKQVTVQMIHQNAENKSRLPNANDSEMELIHFDSRSYPDAASMPRISDQPLFIATSPQNDTLFANLDGFMDEVRISNTVRNFAVPPIISGITELGNQQSGESYEIGATIETLGDASISSATLNYRVDGGSFSSMQMTEGTDNHYTATIPAQSVGSTVNYYVSAETAGGLSATNPAAAITETDTTTYQFAVWEDSTTVFHLNFDQGDDIPTDQSQFDADITLHGANEAATYGEGDGGADDQAMQFTASDTTWLETNSAVHQLQNLAVQFNFYAQDSVPATDTRLLAKGPASSLYLSNYQIYFDPGGALRPAIFASDNSLSPCGSYTGGCLVLDEQGQGRVQAETWYQVQIGIRAPDSTTSPTTEGVIYSRLVNLDADSVEGEKVINVDGAASTSTSSLKIGGTGGTAPYFNGLMDDIQIMNYVPNSHLPDSVEGPGTAIETPGELPEQVRLQQNTRTRSTRPPTSASAFRRPLTCSWTSMTCWAAAWRR